MKGAAIEPCFVAELLNADDICGHLLVQIPFPGHRLVQHSTSLFRSKVILLGDFFIIVMLRGVFFAVFSSRILCYTQKHLCILKSSEKHVKNILKSWTNMAIL